MKNYKRIILLSVSGIFLVIIAGLSFAFYCNCIIQKSDQYCYSTVESLPFCETGLVLGASKKTASGKPNLYYTGRVEAAAKLFHAGKIRNVLVSGDNGRKGYDEPTDIKNSLIELGIPESAIVLDYAGFRTLDSIVRAKNVFGKKSFTVITQKGHAERAIYIARKKDIEAIGFYAEEPVRYKWLIERNRKREKLAWIAAWLDVNILNRSPKFPR